MSEVSNPHERDFVNPDHSNQVLYQLSELWRDKKLCDATIEVGPVKVYVHRLVLLATCPYLLTIGGQYDVPLLEVKLPMSVGLEGLNIFLTYLYDGVLHLTTTNLVSVEKISKILRVSTIKKFCREFRELNEAIIAKDSGLDKFSTDYSLKVTENSIQIIFAELNTGETTVKREAADSDSEIPDPKRRRVNIQSLSPVLQHTTPTPSFTSICVPQQVSSEQSTKAPSSRSDISDSGNQSVSCDNSVLSIKQEPQDYSEEMFLTTDNESSTDFVKRAAYNTETLHSQDEDSMASSSQSNPPSSSQQSLRYHSPVTYMSENNQQTEDRVDPKQVLKNVMKNFADGSTTDTGSEHQMSSENWDMYMVRPLAQKKKQRTELPLEKKVELIRDFRVSPNTKQKHFALKYGLGHSTVSDILKKGDFYLKQYEENADLNKRRFHNSCKFEELNRFMWSWYLEAKARGVPVSGTLIQERALKYAQEQNIPEFKASNGWLQSWKSRYSIKSFKPSTTSNEGSLSNDPNVQEESFEENSVQEPY